MRAPSTNSITLPFGATSAPYSAGSPHKGTDFSYLPDNKIYAPFSGKVTQVANNGNDGNGSYMTDPQGRLHGMLHASQYLVPNGSQVTEGQAIAVMGDTGFAQGVHLHWAVKQNGVFIDPMSIIKQGDTMTDAEIMAEFSKRDKRMDKIEADVSQLYKTLDEVNKSNQADIEDLGRLYQTVDSMNTRLATVEAQGGGSGLPPGTKFEAEVK